MKKKLTTLIALLTLIASCKNKIEINTKDDSSSSKSNEKCQTILTKAIEERKDFFSVTEGLSISKKELSSEALNCMPTKIGVHASVETYLKYAESQSTGTKERETNIVLGSIETYLKYEEGLGSRTAEVDTEVISSVETYLKFAEAVGVLKDNSNISSVETFLKIAEATGANVDSVDSSVETYLKYAEALGQQIDTSNLYTRSTLETGLKFSEALGSNYLDYYSETAAFSLTGHWSLVLDTPGYVGEGIPVWNEDKPLSSYFNAEVAFDDVNTQAILDKGVVAYGVSEANFNYLTSLNPEKTDTAISTILDKGLVYNDKALEAISNMNINDALAAERLMDKGLIGDKVDKGIEPLTYYANFAVDFSEADKVLDKGMITQEKTFNVIKAIMENNLLSTDESLDYGYVILPTEDSIIIFSVENYLKYAEAVGS